MVTVRSLGLNPPHSLLSIWHTDESESFRHHPEDFPSACFAERWCTLNNLLSVHKHMEAERPLKPIQSVEVPQIHVLCQPRWPRWNGITSRQIAQHSFVAFSTFPNQIWSFDLEKSQRRQAGRQAGVPGWQSRKTQHEYKINHHSLPRIASELGNYRDNILFSSFPT